MTCKHHLVNYIDNTAYCTKCKRHIRIAWREQYIATNIGRFATLLKQRKRPEPETLVNEGPKRVCGR
jgi:hypothetical protein